MPINKQELAVVLSAFAHLVDGNQVHDLIDNGMTADDAEATFDVFHKLLKHYGQELFYTDLLQQKLEAEA